MPRTPICLMALATALAIAATTATEAAEPLIRNGDFLTPTAPADYYLQAPGEHTPAGWGVPTGTVDIYSSALAGFGDTQSANLNGTGPGSVRQTATTTPGTTYTLTWRHAPDTWTGDPYPSDPDDPPRWPESCAAKPLADQKYTVSVTGQRESTHTPVGTAEEPRWEAQRITFTAGEDDTALQFTSQTSTDSLRHCGPQITQVRLTPQPAS